MSDMSDNFQLDLNGEKIDEDHDYFLPEGFIEAVEFDPYLHYSDTDSLYRNNKIVTNKCEIEIGEFYEKAEGIEIINNDKYTKRLTQDYLTPSVSQDNKSNKLVLENKRISYVMKHKVKKEMFRVNVKGDEVIITCDHSLIVLRKNKLIKIKPGDVEEDDRLLKIYRTS